MSERTEQDVQRSIEETGGIPEIELELEVSGMTQYPVDKTLSISDMAADAKETGDAIADSNAAIAQNASDIAEIKSWTGINIPVNDTPNAPSIAEAINDVTSVSYPVGSVYMTISNNPPSFDGVWVEIGITATWAQLKKGTRGVMEMPEGQGGPIHFWLRTE